MSTDIISMKWSKCARFFSSAYFHETIPDNCPAEYFVVVIVTATAVAQSVGAEVAQIISAQYIGGAFISGVLTATQLISQIIIHFIFEVIADRSFIFALFRNQYIHFHFS